MRTLPVLVASLVCLALLPRGGPAAPAASTKSVLDDLPGMQRPVTYSEARIPLGELVRRVAAETGVRVYADRTTADEPAAVVVTGMPAARLLNEVARFFDYRWGREGNPDAWRYRLYQDRKQQEGEQALRNAARADEERRLRIVLNAYVKVGQLSDAEYATQREELDRRPPGSPRPSVEQDQFYRGLRECGSSARRGLARLLGRLTPQDWQALWQGQRLRMYSKPEAGERGLPPDEAQSLAGFHPSTSWDAQRQLLRADEFGDSPEDRAQFREQLRRSYERQDRFWDSAEGVRVVIRLHRPSEMGRMYSRDRAAPSLTAAVVPLANNPPEGGPVRLAPEQLRVWIWASTTQPQWGYDSPERLAELEKDPVFTTRQPFSPGKPPVEDWRGTLVYGQIPDLLPDIAHTYGVSVLADSYRPTPVVPGSAFIAPLPPAAGAAPAPGQAAPPAVVPAAPITLGALLAKLSGHYENDIGRITYNYYRWDRQEQLLRLRDRTWFFDRPKEMPRRLTDRWDRMLAVQGALSLNEYATGVASLTDDQWDSIAENNYSPVFPPGYGTIPSRETYRDVLRLFGSLNVVQRQRLERGAPISWAEMNAAQRNLFLSVVEDLNLTSPVATSRADLAAATLELSAEPLDLTRRKQGGRSTDRTVPRGFDPAEYSQLFDDVPRQPDPAAQPAAPKPPVPPVTYTRFPVTSVRFVIRCGRAAPAVTSITVGAAGR